VTAFLKGFDEFVLVLRQDAGEDRELLRVDSVGDRAGRAEGAIKSYRLRDDDASDIFLAGSKAANPEP
jgi:hypothetical protein